MAQTTGAWVITGGTNTGVMKHVGEALQVSSKGRFGSQGDSRKKVYCIGIATWGIVEHRKELTNKKVSFDFGRIFSQLCLLVSFDNLAKRSESIPYQANFHVSALFMS